MQSCLLSADDLAVGALVANKAWEKECISAARCVLLPPVPERSWVVFVLYYTHDSVCLYSNCLAVTSCRFDV